MAVAPSFTCIGVFTAIALLLIVLLDDGVLVWVVVVLVVVGVGGVTASTVAPAAAGDVIEVGDCTVTLKTFINDLWWDECLQQH